MPSVTLTEIGRMRVEALSFFAACFPLACAWVIQRIWNGLRADIPELPRLSYGQGRRRDVQLWGLLFLLVLTMISGTPESCSRPVPGGRRAITFKVDPGPALSRRR